MFSKHRHFDRMTKRELLKSPYREWSKLGRNVARRFVFCDLSRAKKHMEFLADIVGYASSRVLDVEAIAQGVFNADARSFFGQHGITIDGF
ncbi:hypothetical protein [Mesorhizobium sp. KR9-304]|uniref:hypothetical protein n=1 Tax=Mesorhizobium sp. KR9-304 TaxID=3156614 RepID=UPI0032B49A10